MKSSKAQIFAKFHKIPTIRFEDQELTSFPGMIVFQLLFKRLTLKKKVIFTNFYATLRLSHTNEAIGVFLDEKIVLYN